VLFLPPSSEIKNKLEIFIPI